MKISIFYFSGTGNTWYAAKELKAALEKECEVELISIEDIVSQEKLNYFINQSDHIVIGYPIYGSMAPKPMIDFINKLPSYKKNISTFTTVSLASGDGPVMYRKIFEEKGYIFKNAVQFITNNNFNVPGFPNLLRVGSDEKVKKRYIRVEEKAKKMATNILKDNAKVHGGKLIGRCLGDLQRKHVEEIIRKINSTFLVDQENCIKCMKCVDFCVVKNIEYKNDEIVINNGCIGCMRCYHICPSHAINITEKSKDIKKWPRFKMEKEFIKTLDKSNT